MALFSSKDPGRTASLFFLAVALCLPAGATTRHSTRKTPHAHHAATSHTRHHAGLRHASSSHSRSRRSRHHHAAALGQRSMDAGRATEIQQALIRAHYLEGAPTGQWDAASQAAMQKFQADNGWQTKIMPDSRALIKLGLGPKQDDGEYGQPGVTQAAASSASPVMAVPNAGSSGTDAAVAAPPAPSGVQD
jgi:hypothetical protein